MRIRSEVEQILQADPLCRGDDKRLFIRFMQRHGMRLSDEQMIAFKKMPSLETVRRTRQSIQMSGKYLPSEAVSEMRYEKSKAIRGGGDVEKVMEYAPWRAGEQT